LQGSRIANTITTNKGARKMTKEKYVETYPSDVDYLKHQIEIISNENRKFRQQLIKLKMMLLVNTNVDWNFSEANAKEEFENLYNSIKVS
jgi:hypothetical protein